MSTIKVLAFLLLLAQSLITEAQTTPPSAPGSAGRLGDAASIATIKLVVMGHWELATPADGIPTATDLTPTPLLSSSARVQQRRFRLKESFSFSLSPGERYLLTGPSIKAADLPSVGRYHVVLKVDSFSSISGAAPKMPNRVAPIVLEVENLRPTVSTPEPVKAPADKSK
jgi:hypothetical protein